jgi:hypothetical protein
MGTRGDLWPASPTAFGLAASSYITTDSWHGYRTPTASERFGSDYGTGIPKQKRSDCDSIYGVGRNRPRAICVRPTMRRVQARIRRERFGHLSTPLPGMSGRHARAGLLNSGEARRGFRCRRHQLRALPWKLGPLALSLRRHLLPPLQTTLLRRPPTS